MGYCKHSACKKNAMYNYKGHTPHYCVLHKQSDMVNVKNKLCETEDCLKTALYNYLTLEGSSTPSPKYCILHKEPDMVNMKDKRCIYSQCSNIALKKDPKTGKVSYCKKHMKELYPEQYAPVSKIHLNEKKKAKQFKPKLHKPANDKPKQEDTMKNKLKYTVDNVNEYCKKYNCELVEYSSVYQNGKEYIPCYQTITVNKSCGHSRIMKLSTFIQNPIHRVCKECSYDDQNKTVGLSKKIFLKRLDLVSRRLNCLRRYYQDFHPDTVYQTIVCCICKKEKPSYLFYSKESNQQPLKTYPFNVYNKLHYCKECGKQKHIRRQATEEATFRNMLMSCIRSSRYRQSIGRIECSQVSITEKDLKEQLMKQNYTCAYSGRPLSFEINQPDRISIDRIDSNKGYTKDNIQFLTTQVNYNKRDSTEDEFMLMVRDVYHTWAKPRLEQMGMSTVPESMPESMPE